MANGGSSKSRGHFTGTCERTSRPRPGHRNMAPRQKKRFWRICRIYFRRIRIFIWVLILLLLGMLLYVNQIGLPGFIKTPLLAKLRARGIELQFSRLRWRWYYGIVAEKVRFGRIDEPLTPNLTMEQVQLHLNYKSLVHFKFPIDSLLLRRGRMVWALAETNTPTRELSVDNIQTDLRLLPGDQWALDHFKANFAGARIQLSGAVTNASALHIKPALRTEPRAPARLWQERLRRLADTLEEVHFSAPPDLRV